MTKLSPQTTLSLLLGAAIGAAGILQGLHWKSQRIPADGTDPNVRIQAAEEEIRMLRAENESLRSLAKGGGELTVPQEFIERVEKEFGLGFVSPPVVHRASPEQLRDRISASIESHFGPSGIDDRQQAYSLIGWLKPDDDLLVQLTIARSNGAVAWFDSGTGEGWVVEKTNLKNIPDRAALVGLLARVLLHQHFPPGADYAGDDADRAREALHQGAAAGAEARFLIEMARGEDFMPMNENKIAAKILSSLSPFVQGLGAFTAVNGKGYADSFHVRGNSALLEAFRSPPRMTAEVLRPGAAMPPSVEFETPAHVEEPFLTESAGQLALFLWLKLSGDAQAAGEISRGWRGDRYFLFPDGEESTAVLWDIEMESVPVTDRLLESAHQIIANRDKEEAQSRHLSVVRISPTKLRFLNTAQATTAAKFAAP